MSSSFADLGVPPSLVSSLAERGIDTPFPIQAATVPDALEGRDVCGRAPTGSGKTIAFGIPMVLDLTSGHSRPKRPRGLVLVPTRELASQVCLELQLLAKPKGPWVEAFYGGVGFDRQLKALQRGVDIAVACPGRLMDLINQKNASLEDVEFVVIDEADRMADMGFLPEVRKLLDMCTDDRQTLLFSATLDGDVDVLIRNYQRDPARHEHVEDDEGGVRAEHLFWKVDREKRVTAAATIVKRLGPTVVFCRTKRGADRLAKNLGTNGVRAAAIHGDRSQKQREEALRAFHQGKVDALVATDVAARGIHVDGVLGVVHYDPPEDPKDYVHRSGRTARAGARGTVVSLVLAEKRKLVETNQKQLGYPVGLAPIDVEVLGPEQPRRKVVRAAAESVATPKAKAKTTKAERSTPVKPKRPKLPAAKELVVENDPLERIERERERARAAERTPKRRDSSSAKSADRPGSGAAKRDDRSARSARDARPAGDDRSAREDRFERRAPVADHRAPLAEGQRRPSGAARRKAKRLAALEAAAMGTGPVAPAADDWADPDLFDGRSSRPRGGAAKPKPTGPKRAKGTSNTKGTKRKRATADRSMSSSRSSAAPKQKQGAGAGTRPKSKGAAPSPASHRGRSTKRP